MSDASASLLQGLDLGSRLVESGSLQDSPTAENLPCPHPVRAGAGLKDLSLELCGWSHVDGPPKSMLHEGKPFSSIGHLYQVYCI